jgi:hypothetical protein
MASEVVAGVVGVCVGAILTTGATWRVSVSKSETRQARANGAICDVRAGLAGNADRLGNINDLEALTHGLGRGAR